MSRVRKFEDQGEAMDRDRNPSPLLSANPFSKALFWWIGHLFSKGKFHDLSHDDLHDVLYADISEILGHRLEKHWTRELEDARQNRRKPKFAKAITNTFIKCYFFYALHMLFLNFLRIMQPFMLGQLIPYFEPKSTMTTSDAYLYAWGLIGLTLAHSLVKHQIDLITLRLGMRLRIACSSLIYRKVVTLSNQSANEIDSGKLINLLTNDVSKFDPFFTYLHYIWITPILVAVIAYLLWLHVQEAAFVGVGLMVAVTIPIQVYISLLTMALRKRIAEKTDDRVQLMNEIIKGIQVIKMYTWEKPFEHLVSLARRYEIDLITTSSYLRGIFIVFNAFIDRICLYSTIMVYAYTGNAVTAATVFSMVQYFTIMQNLLAYNYPKAIINASDALVSMKRIQELLMMGCIRIKAPTKTLENNASLILANTTASWVPHSIVKTVFSINMYIAPHKLHAIVGPIGSGKSSLLQVMLGELRIFSGEMQVNGTISYAAQRPWLFPGTIRENIVFDEKYVEARFHKVVRVCGLSRDLARMPHGEHTQVGDRGTNLSGGQCARVNLARAVYRDADIYILDDPFASVDATVSKYLFEECIVNYLKDKTRVFVTHRYKYVKEADQIFVLENGRIKLCGKPEEFTRQDLQFLNISIEEEAEESTIRPENESNLEHANPDAILVDISRYNYEDMKPEPQESEELIAKGKMKISIFLKYFRCGNSLFLLISTLLLFILAQFVRSGSDVLLAYWTHTEELRLNAINSGALNATQAVINSTESPLSTLSTLSTSMPETTSTLLSSTTLSSTTIQILVTDVTESSMPNKIQDALPTTNESLDLSTHSPYDLLDILNATEKSSTASGDELYNPELHNMLLVIYGGILVLCCISALGKCILFYRVCMNASKAIHNLIFGRILRAPLRFFDKLNSGQILNRFSKDMGTMDEVLPYTMHESIEVFSIFLGVIGQVVVVSWWSCFAMVIAGYLYVKLKEFYVPTSYGIKRLEGAAKSPMLSYVTSTLEGLTTIRSRGARTTVIRRFDTRQDMHTRAHFLSIATASAFGLWLDLVSNLLVAVVVLGSVLFNSGFAGGVGLAITQILMLCGMLQRGIRQSAEAATQMTCVERIFQFTKLDRENLDEGNKPSDEWPSNGKIEYREVCLRHATNEEPVIRNASFIIEPATKVGVVGRTGAGKTSLISALFRTIEVDGQVLIDGVDTSTLSLAELRKRIAIIPQEPVMFSATLRDNLDALREHPDTAFREALKSVEMENAVERLDQRMDCSGKNLSSGERQLFCLARALVKNSRILILDEATANLDPQTDRIVRRTIEDKFSQCTVLTIAHRLESVIRSQKIIVVKNGEVVEYGHPHMLLTYEGDFTRMAKQTGEATFVMLKNAAEQEFLNLHLRANVSSNASLNNVLNNTAGSTTENTHDIRIIVEKNEDEECENYTETAELSTK